jgi:hypothetical protein
LASMIEDVSGWRFTADAVSQVASGSGGSATVEKQDEILALLATLAGDGFEGATDSLEAIRDALRLAGVAVPDDMTGDPTQDLPIIRTQLYARLMSVLSSAKPNYSIDGQSVSWQSYQDMLLKQIQAVDMLIEGQNPFETTSRAKV